MSLKQRAATTRGFEIRHNGKRMARCVSTSYTVFESLSSIRDKLSARRRDEIAERKGQDAALNTCRCGPQYPGVDHRLLSRDVHHRAVFARRSYSPVSIVTAVNWASHFGIL